MMSDALVAVATAPPKRFAGGGYREAMKGDMTRWFELRVDGRGRHQYRPRSRDCPGLTHQPR